MDDAKYIIANGISNGFGTSDFVPFIFPNFISHDAFARNIGVKKEDIVSAGFISIGNDGSVHPYGKSVSLGKECVETDQELFDSMFRTQAYYDNGGW